MAGAGTGAMVGSAVMPGIGTAVGAGAGLLFGGFLGPMLSGSVDAEKYALEQAQTRAKLGQFTNRLGQWAEHGNPHSVAQQMVQHNRGENAATQVGMAKTMGGDNALANRIAAEGVTRGNLESSYQGQVLKAQEQQAATQQYLAAMDAQRMRDIEMYNAKQGNAQVSAARDADFYGGMLNEGAKAAGGAMNGGGGSGGSFY
jgi:hypothetical protein